MKRLCSRITSRTFGLRSRRKYVRAFPCCRLAVYLEHFAVSVHGGWKVGTYNSAKHSIKIVLSGDEEIVLDVDAVLSNSERTATITAVIS